MSPQIVIGAICLVLAGLWFVGLWLAKKPAQSSKVDSLVEAHRSIVTLIATTSNPNMLEHLREAGKALYDPEKIP
jgi:hypothetical protein